VSASGAVCDDAESLCATGGFVPFDERSHSGRTQKVEFGKIHDECCRLIGEAGHDRLS
jgi:hypothetical protein